MEIVRVQRIDELSSARMQAIEKMFTEGFKGEIVKREFSWQSFLSYWEVALQLPWNALWLLIDDIDEDKVFGIIGGVVFPSMLTEGSIAAEVCWRTAKEIKGKGGGWDLLTDFIDWALTQGATRIVTHRFLHSDEASDERFDSKIKAMGFYASGCEYYMDV